MTLNNCLTMSHEYIKKNLSKDSITIDATAGNGNDTLFLAKNSKKVFAFDIQETAILNTKKLLEQNNISNVQLIHDSHININLYNIKEANAIMFNLGYLPKYNHKISTNYKSTIEAIKKSMNILKKSGLISIVIYHGEDSGVVERDKVLEFIKQINDDNFRVLKLSYENQRNNPPILVVIEKK